MVFESTQWRSVCVSNRLDGIVQGENLSPLRCYHKNRGDNWCLRLSSENNFLWMYIESTSSWNVSHFCFVFGKCRVHFFFHRFIITYSGFYWVIVITWWYNVYIDGLRMCPSTHVTGFDQKCVTNLHDPRLETQPLNSRSMDNSSSESYSPIAHNSCNTSAQWKQVLSDEKHVKNIWKNVSKEMWLTKAMK
jgi:hypothetical protein